MKITSFNDTTNTDVMLAEMICLHHLAQLEQKDIQIPDVTQMHAHAECTVTRKVLIS
jgi:hypothetical protein